MEVVVIVDLVFVSEAGPTSALSANNKETAEIYNFISHILKQSGLNKDEIAILSDKATAWCENAKDNEMYNDLKKYGIEMVSYNENSSAEKLSSVLSTSKDEYYYDFGMKHNVFSVKARLQQIVTNKSNKEER